MSKSITQMTKKELQTLVYSQRDTIRSLQQQLSQCQQHRAQLNAVAHEADNIHQLIATLVKRIKTLESENA